MSSGEGLLLDIIENPGDDCLRRIYADWLDDEGQHDRAELVRVQLDLAALDDDDPRRDLLQQREGQLLRRHQTEWLEPFTVRGEGVGWVHFHRGFPSQWVLDVSAFLCHGEAIFSRTPLSSLRFGDLSSEVLVDQLWQSPILDRVEELNLEGSNLSVWNFVKLLQHRPLSQLRRLTLNKLPIGHMGLSALLRHPISLRLNALSLIHCDVRGNAIEELCACPNLGELVTLDLGENQLGAIDMQFLGSARHLPALRELKLNGNRIGPTAVRDLAQSSRLRALEALHLGFNPLGSDGVEELARTSCLTQLDTLDLSHTNVSVGATAALSRAAFFPRLRRFDLSGNQIGGDAISALVRGQHVAPLTFLDLSDNDLDDDAARTLGTWSGLSRLRRLVLSRNRIRAHGLRPLLFSPFMGPLIELRLNQNPLGDMGGQVLARWSGLKRLHLLEVAHSRIGDVGASELVDAINRLDWLNIRENQMSSTSVQRLNEAADTGRIGQLDCGDQLEA